MSLKFWHQPKRFLLLYLCLLYLFAVWRVIGLNFVSHELGRALALLAGFGLPHFVGILVWKNKPSLENIFIVSLIILLLANHQTGFFAMFILGLLTALIKTIFRLHHQPIFNPAAAGLFAASFLGVTTTWWGVSFSPRLPFYSISAAMLLTVPAGLYLIWLYKRIPTLLTVTLSFLVVYFLLKGTFPVLTVLEGTFAFFLFVMAIEPKTTPVVDKQEWLYGTVLGSGIAFLYVVRLVGSPYLVVLLSANLLFSLYLVLLNYFSRVPKEVAQDKNKNTK